MSAAAIGVFAFVLNALWQSTAIVLLVWAALRLVPRANATTRCIVWLSVLLASLLLPILSSGFAMRSSAPALPIVASQGSAAPVPGVLSIRHAPASASAPAARLGLRVTVFPWIAAAVAVAWIGGVSFLLFRLVASLFYLERLKQNALPFPLDLRDRLPRWKAAMKGAREVRLCISDSIGVPVAIGLFDAMILVPNDLVALAPSELDCILLHELAHLRRGDDWSNAAQRTIAALLFFSPAVAYACSRLDVEREVACDDAVLQKVSDPLDYANCLARMAQAVAWPHRELAAPGIFSTRRGTSQRIERLLDPVRNVSVRAALGPLALVLTIIASASLLGAYATPSFVSPTQPEIATTLSEEHVASSQLAYSGTWKIEPSDKSGSVNFGLSYSMSNASDDVALTTLGLAPEALRGASHPIEFEVKKDAGTFACRGAIAQGSGSGSFVFVPDEAYVKAFDASRTVPLSLGQQVQAGMFDLDISYVEGIAAAGFANAPLDTLLGFKMFGVTPEFARSLRADFPDVQSSSLIGIRMASDKHHVDLHALHVDFPSESLDAIVALAVAGVTPSYVAALRTAEVRDLSADNVAALFAHGVDQAFADRLAAKGPRGLSVDEVVKLKNETP